MGEKPYLGIIIWLASLCFWGFIWWIIPDGNWPALIRILVHAVIVLFFLSSLIMFIFCIFVTIKSKD